MGRKKKRRINERIEIKEWDEYFRGLLGGVEWRVRKGGERGRDMDEEGDLGLEEIKRVVMKLKDGKAGGGDEIQNEVWKYGGEEVMECLWVICSRVWRGKGGQRGGKKGWWYLC